MVQAPTEHVEEDADHDGGPPGTAGRAARLGWRAAGALLLGALVLGAVLGIVALVIKRGRPSMGDEDSDELDLVTIFDSVELTSRARSFRGGSWLAMFGGGELDLNGAVLDPTGAVLRLRAIMGGGRVEVPIEWNVELKSRGIMGSSPNHRPETDRDPNAPTLRLDAATIMGGFVVTSEGSSASPASRGRDTLPRTGSPGGDRPGIQGTDEVRT